MERRKSSKKNKKPAKNQPPTKQAVTRAKSAGMPQEDADLWAKVTNSLTPLRGGRDRLHFGPLLDEKPAVPPEQAKSIDHGSSAQASPNKASPNKVAPAARVSARGTLNARPLSQQQINLPQQDGFSRREMRQISKGHQSIDARLDLHGMRQAEAHMALTTFLSNAQTRGFRHVLVITGKGRSNASNEMMFGDQEPGVLRRVVPLWLNEPDLRELVAGFSEAPIRHGGEGALYIRLRRGK